MHSSSTAAPAAVATTQAHAARIARSILIGAASAAYLKLDAPALSATRADSPCRRSPAAGRGPSPGGSSAPLQEVAEQRVAVLGQERLGVELHALDGERAVAHAHDLAVLGGRADLEAGGQRRGLDRQRVVARDRERRRNAGEHA